VGQSTSPASWTYRRGFRAVACIDCRDFGGARKGGRELYVPSLARAELEAS